MCPKRRVTMKKWNVIRYLMVSLLSVFMFGCNVNSTIGPDNEESATYDLCRYVWVTNYMENSGTEVFDEFFFDSNGRGSEIMTYFYSNGRTESKQYDFDWYWTSNSYRSVCLEYGPDNVLYMDDLFISGNRMTCYMAGMSYVFNGE